MQVNLEVQSLSRSSSFRREGRIDLTINPSMKLFPDVYFDLHSNLLVSVITSASAEGSMALVFEPQTAAAAAQRRLLTEPGDKIYCSPHGVHLEHNASIFRRLKINPEGNADTGEMDAEDALFAGRHYHTRTRSIDTLPTTSRASHLSSGSGSGSATGTTSSAAAYRTMSHATTDMTSVSSRAAHNVKVKSGKIKHTWGRGTASTATDESWMLEKQREHRWMKEAADD